MKKHLLLFLSFIWLMASCDNLIQDVSGLQQTGTETTGTTSGGSQTGTTATTGSDGQTDQADTTSLLKELTAASYSVVDYSGALTTSSVVHGNTGLQGVKLRIVSAIGKEASKILELGSVLASDTGYDLEFSYDFPVKYKTSNSVIPDKDYVKVYFTGLWHSNGKFYYVRNRSVRPYSIDIYSQVYDDREDTVKYYLSVGSGGQVDGLGVSGEMVSGSVSIEVTEGGIIRRESGEALEKIRIDNAFYFRTANSNIYNRVLRKTPVYEESNRADFDDPDQKIAKILYPIIISSFDSNKIKLNGTAVASSKIAIQNKALQVGAYKEYVSQIEIDLKGLVSAGQEYTISFDDGALTSDGATPLKGLNWKFFKRKQGSVQGFRPICQ